MTKGKNKTAPKRRKRPAGNKTAAVEQTAEELFRLGKFVDALHLLDDVIDRGQPTATTWRLVGTGLMRVAEHAQAVGAFQRALEFGGNDPEARFSLGEALFQMGDVPAAVNQFEQVARAHDHMSAWCNLATIIPGDPQSSNQRIMDIRREFGDRLAAAEPKRYTIAPIDRDDRERIRIGYVSAYFRNENYMKPVWELIRLHDRNRFEIHLFADDATEDDFGWFTPAPFDRVHLTTALLNQQLIEMIRSQQIDVLIDLNAYSVPLRLPIYTHRLSRIVATWFNMYATSGLPGIDWIIGDTFVAAETEDQFYTERVARLSQSYLSFGVNYQTPDVAAPSCLENGLITFGSLVSQYKMTPVVYDAWSRILDRCKNAKLVLANRTLSSQCNREYVLEQFSRRGVDPNRISLLPPADHQQFLRYYDRIDIALDAFPYNGGTTTTEAMWQGVPTLAIKGDRWASRTSGTLLVNSHLGDFVTESVDGYVEKAIRMALDPKTPQWLSRVRMTIREELRRSPVCDTTAMARNFEDVLTEIVRLGPELDSV